MSKPDFSNINFEIQARSDPRYWLSLIVGISMITTTAILLNTDTHWIWWALLCGGVILFYVGAQPLFLNTSRGCFIDPETQDFYWWHNKKTHERLDQKNKIQSHQIGTIFINNSGDTLEIRMYDLNNNELNNFREWCIPSNYNLWIDNFCQKYPNIQIKKN